jgi:hypothetical protein
VSSKTHDYFLYAKVPYTIFASSAGAVGISLNTQIRHLYTQFKRLATVFKNKKATRRWLPSKGFPPVLFGD